jgi:hypothetical protein
LEGRKGVQPGLAIKRHNFTILETTANPIMDITPNDIIDSQMTIDKYLNDDRVKAMRAELYKD